MGTAMDEKMAIKRKEAEKRLLETMYAVVEDIFEPGMSKEEFQSKFQSKFASKEAPTWVHKLVDAVWDFGKAIIDIFRK